MESKLEGFAKIKWEVGLIQFDNLSMNSDKTAIEANPATHRIAEYIEANYVLKEQALEREKELVEALEAIKKWDFTADGRKFGGDHKEVIKQIMSLVDNALASQRLEKEVVECGKCGRMTKEGYACNECSRIV
jgi:hypothetical protein